MTQNAERRPSLIRLVAHDFAAIGRLPAFLLLLVLLSALAVVWVTHSSRQMIAQQELLLIERDQLDTEWRNQILEENSLAEHSRVSEIAERELEMKRPDPDSEVVVH